MYGGKGTYFFVPLDVVLAKSNHEEYQARVP